MTKHIAVVLAGAVAKGAFEAGALAELVKHDVKVTRIVAASSGALNGTVLAAAVHAANSRSEVSEAMEGLCKLWVEHGDVWDAFNLDVADIVRRKGFSDQKRLRRLLEQNVRHSPKGLLVEKVVLTTIVAPIAGCATGGGCRSTFELARHFENRAFADEAGLRSVFEAAVASASFPIAFAPSPIDGVGPCVDGGTVNNAPIGYALDGKAPVEEVVVLAPTPANAQIPIGEADALHGFSLIARLADMLINERLQRDLAEARRTNHAFAEIENDETLAPHLVAIMRAVGWGNRKPMPIQEIRPETELEGNPFSGFGSSKIRSDYVDAGRKRAVHVLGAPPRTSSV